MEGADDASEVADAILARLRLPPPVSLRFARTDEPLPGAAASPKPPRRSSLGRLAQRLSIIK